MKNMHNFHKYTFTNRGTKVGYFIKNIILHLLKILGSLLYNPYSLSLQC